MTTVAMITVIVAAVLCVLCGVICVRHRILRRNLISEIDYHQQCIRKLDNHIDRLHNIARQIDTGKCHDDQIDQIYTLRQEHDNRIKNGGDVNKSFEEFISKAERILYK